MTKTPKLSPEYRVRWRRASWLPSEHATVVVLGNEHTARKAAGHIAGMYDDVCEMVIESRQVSAWWHRSVFRLDDRSTQPANDESIAPAEISGDDEQVTTPAEPAIAVDLAIVQRAIAMGLITAEEAPRFLAGSTLEEAIADAAVPKIVIPEPESDELGPEPAAPEPDAVDAPAEPESEPDDSPTVRGEWASVDSSGVTIEMNGATP